MRVLLADDHEMFLDALRLGLERRGRRVVSSSAGLDGLLALVLRDEPDVCVLDLDFAGRSSLDVIGLIRERRPDVRIVLLTGSAVSSAWDSFAGGLVDGLVNKLCDIAVLDGVLDRVLAGERVVERFVQPAPARPHEAGHRVRLSVREQDVLGLLVSGASTSEVADSLAISQHTARSHVRSVLQKLEVGTRAKAVTRAIELGVVPAQRALRDD